MNNQTIINQNLTKATVVLTVLQLKFPSEVGPVDSDTVVAFQKNSRKLNPIYKIKKISDVLNGDVCAFYQDAWLDEPFTIFIMKHFLLRPMLHLDSFVIKALTPRMIKKIPSYLTECDCCDMEAFNGSNHTVTWIFDDWAIMDIIAHEAAHGGTRGHGQLWQKKYLKFLKTLFDLQISGRLKLDDISVYYRQSEDFKV